MQPVVSFSISNVDMWPIKAGSLKSVLKIMVPFGIYCASTVVYNLATLLYIQFTILKWCSFKLHLKLRVFSQVQQWREIAYKLSWNSSWIELLWFRGCACYIFYGIFLCLIWLPKCTHSLPSLFNWGSNSWSLVEPDVLLPETENEFPTGFFHWALRLVMTGLVNSSQI